MVPEAPSGAESRRLSSKRMPPCRATSSVPGRQCLPCCQHFVAQTWPKRPANDWLNRAERRKLTANRLQTGPLRGPR
jgi:hypothetical protein